MPAFVPDVPFHIVIVFLLTFSFIWGMAFYGDPDYIDNMPTDNSDEWAKIAKKNVWQAITSVIIFMSAFAYLRPYVETVQNAWM